MSTTQIDLLSLSQSQLTELMATLGEPAFRAKQINRQLYVNHVRDIAHMTDLSLSLRQKLASQATIGSLTLQRVVSADNQMTHKALFTLPSG